MPAALITGASSGIGRALALQLARAGRELVLLGRDERALEEAAGECRRAGAARAEWIARDLLDPHAPAQVHAELEARGREIGILVNNAGIGVHGAFAQTAIEREIGLAHLQVDATLRLTKLFLPGMIERGEGRILNVASVYSYAPVPFQSVYGAAKAFLLSFSEALAFELKGSGVTVTVLCPGTTRTEFRRRADVKRPGERESGMDPALVARQGVAALMRGRFVCVPGAWYNTLFTQLMRHLPHALRGWLMYKINAKRGLAGAPAAHRGSPAAAPARLQAKASRDSGSPSDRAKP